MGRTTSLVEYGAVFVLTFNAGYTNAVALAGVFHAPVSHVTGTLTRIGLDLTSKYKWDDLERQFGLIFSFGFGSFICGLITHRTKYLSAFYRQAGYGVSLGIVSLLLLLSTLTSYSDFVLSNDFSSMACGLQNGIATHSSGMTLRTTHMTGVVTDIAMVLSHIVWQLINPVAHFLKPLTKTTTKTCSGHAHTTVSIINDSNAADSNGAGTEVDKRATASTPAGERTQERDEGDNNKALSSASTIRNKHGNGLPCRRESKWEKAGEHAAREFRKCMQKLRVLLLLMTGFLCGGIMGGMAHQQFSNHALYFPAGLTAVLSLAQLTRCALSSSARATVVSVDRKKSIVRDVVRDEHRSVNRNNSGNLLGGALMLAATNCHGDLSTMSLACS
jgi:uncharacterized membrane protein YoaK (UPF0700 family)